MSARSTHHAATNLFVRIVLPALAVLDLSACVTDEEYARQLCLQSGVASGSSGYESCLSEQRNWIEDNWQRDSYPYLNG
jgi:hypothetical protein